MSGICGFVDLRSELSEVTGNDRLRKMCKVIEHRGPEAFVFYHSQDHRIHLGITKLRKMPFDEDGQKARPVVFDGEIYNYASLRAYLEKSGYLFETTGVEELILAAYDHWGVEFLSHMEGMVACAMVDEKSNHLILVRDRIGQKPLYYAQTPHAFIFGSEIKAILSYSDPGFEINEQALSLFISLGYIPAPLTIFQHIYKLPAGHYLVIDEDGVPQCNRYWNFPAAEQASSSLEINSCSAHLQELLEHSFRAQLPREQAFGILLSGGLDSSLVVALARKFTNAPIKTFTANFPGTKYDETSYAKVVAECFHADYFDLSVSNCLPDLLRKLVWHCDEPLADPAIVPTYLVSKLAKEHVDVVLTGDGPDQFFAGFYYHVLEEKASHLDWLPGFARQGLLVPAAELINKLTGRNRYHHRTLWSWKLGPAERNLAWVTIFTDDEVKRWFSPRITSQATPSLAVQHFRHVSREHARYRSSCFLDNVLYLDSRIQMADALMMKVDKMSMAVSLQARCPYLDHHVAEYSFSLPGRMKLHNGTNKWILRKIASELLPEHIVKRAKQGLSVPLKAWLSNDLNTMFWDLVTSQKFTSSEIISRAQIDQIWSNMINDIDNSAKQVWSLLILAAWQDILPSRQNR
jgi:asparagine synthase (glutamine-hydrolysing)